MKKNAALAAATILLLLLPAAALADTANIDFEAYSIGTVHGQDGWSALGSVGMGCALYDVEVVDSAPYPYPSFGLQSLRQSNAVTSGCFGDQTFSTSLANEAGETDATNNGYSGGTRQPYFEAQWSFASTDPGAEQPGLSVVASPDRGDGARMSWVQMADQPDGLEVVFYDYLRGRTVDPCGCCPPFGCTTVATGLDRTVPHTIKITMDLYDGESNDIVKVYVDGVLVHTGTSWEDYFRDNEIPPVSRTVDSILLRTGGSPAPATAGKGFLIDNMQLVSGSLQVGIDLRPGNTGNQINPSSRQLVPIAILGNASFDPYTEADIDSVRVRGASPSLTRYDSSDVNGDGYVDLVIYFRARDFDPPDPAECGDPDAVIELTGVTSEGIEFSGTDYVQWLGPSCN